MNEITGAARDVVTHPAFNVFLTYVGVFALGGFAKDALVAGWKKLRGQVAPTLEELHKKIDDLVKLIKAQAGNAAIDFGNTKTPGK